MLMVKRLGDIGIKGQRRGIRGRRKTLNVDEEALKGNEKVL